MRYVHNQSAMLQERHPTAARLGIQLYVGPALMRILANIHVHLALTGTRANSKLCTHRVTLQPKALYLEYSGESSYSIPCNSNLSSWRVLHH